MTEVLSREGIPKIRLESGEARAGEELGAVRESTET